MILMLFKLEDADYEPLTSFSLLWRWTSPRYTELPTDVLECIRPIAQRKAALINDYAIKRVHSERRTAQARRRVHFDPSLGGAGLPDQAPVLAQSGGIPGLP